MLLLSSISLQFAVTPITLLNVSLHKKDDFSRLPTYYI